MHQLTRKTLISLAVATLAANGGVFAQGLADLQGESPIVDVAGAAEAQFSMEQIEQMVAPVALYPDTVLAQVLMAATYPLEVAQAAQWRRNNPGLEGGALDDALADQPWDASVKTLVLFPEIHDRMAGDLAWTQDLGDAFLAQEGDVMAAVQELRRRAEESGNLSSNDQQIVRKTGSTIIVEPADPAVVYVPSYNPTVVYGPGFTTVTRTTYYPTVYRSYESTPTWMVFGAGVAVGALLTAVIDWSDDDDYYVVHRHYRPGHHHIWHHGPSYWSSDWEGPRFGRPGWRDYRPAYVRYGDVNIDRSRTVNIQRNTNVQNNVAVRQWQHTPAHRAGVRYRDPKVGERFTKTQGTGSVAQPPPGVGARPQRDLSGSRPAGLAMPQPGVQPGIQPGLKPAVRPGLQPGGQAELQPGARPALQPGVQRPGPVSRPWQGGPRPGQGPAGGGLTDKAGSPDSQPLGQAGGGGDQSPQAPALRPDAGRRQMEALRRGRPVQGGAGGELQPGMQQPKLDQLPSGQIGQGGASDSARPEIQRRSAESLRWQRPVPSPQPTPGMVPRSSPLDGGGPVQRPELKQRPPVQMQAPASLQQPRPEVQRRPTFQQSPPQRRLESPPPQRLQAPPQSHRVQPPPPKPQNNQQSSQGGSQQQAARKRNPPASERPD